MTKLIVTDLDGTLLNNQGEISSYTARVILALKAKGYRFAYATGRPLKMAYNHIKFLSPAYSVLSNGALVYEGFKLLRRLYIPTKSQNMLIKDLLAVKEVLQISIETEDKYYSNLDDSKEIPHIWKALNIQYNDLKQGINDLSPQMSVVCTNPRIVPELVKKYSDLRFFANRGNNWYQFAHRDASKLEGIKLVAKCLNISLEDVVAFGDDYNDFEMLKGCGIGVAMANAANDVKNVADSVCGDNNRDGVAKWLEKHLL